MKILTTLFTLVIAATAAPTTATLTKRTLAPAQASFFYDTQCKEHAGDVTLALDITLPGKKTGGPYGSRSAMFTDTGGAVDWDILGGAYGDFVHKPNPGVCKTWVQPGFVDGGIFVWASALI
ncbi:MAG: hypothetical protein MMC33_007940 [Icmadophila ericetorum]|nr:hypothetical protein [Icmadophila ericetorum]